MQNPLDWSRDGRNLLFYMLSQETQRDMWIATVTPDGHGLGDPKPYLRSPFNEWHGSFSPEPNPRWVAYSSDESGSFEVYVRSFPDGKNAHRISIGGGDFPTWGEGGREILYLARGTRVMSVNLKLGPDSVEPSAPRELFSTPPLAAGFRPYDFDSSSQRLLMLVAQGTEQPLRVLVNWSMFLKRT